MIWRLGCLLLVTLLASGCAGGIKSPGEVKPITMADGAYDRAVLLTGAFSRISHIESLRQSDLLVVDSGGGRLSEAFILVPHLQRNATTLYIPNGARCMSACLLMMAASDDVVVGPDAKFLIHEVRRHGRYSPDGTLKIRGYLRAQGWPPELIDEGAQENAERRFDGKEAVQLGLASGFLCGDISEPSNCTAVSEYPPANNAP